MSRLDVEFLETRLLLAPVDTSPPLISIKEPAADAQVEIGSDLQFAADASDPDSGVSQVAFAYRVAENATVELDTDTKPEDGFKILVSTKSMPLGAISLIATATNGLASWRLQRPR